MTHESVAYVLPDGRRVLIHRDAARDAGLVTYALADGTVVLALIAAGERERLACETRRERLRGTTWRQE